jgi:hypothetical protein
VLIRPAASTQTGGIFIPIDQLEYSIDSVDSTPFDSAFSDMLASLFNCCMRAAQMHWHKLDRPKKTIYDI